MQRSRFFTWTIIGLALAAATLTPISSRAVRVDTSAAAIGPDPAAAPDPAPARDALVAMFVWWNAAYKQKEGFTAESFSRYFTPDAVMRINGKDRCRGLADLARHFRDIQASTEMVVIELPFIDEFTSPNGDRIFTHHFVRAREQGKDSRERVMGYASIKDGKISLINFVSVPDPLPAGSGQKK
jgi:ketosteroid isomerase-like protein